VRLGSIPQNEKIAGYGKNEIMIAKVDQGK
jgi:hypothetical protein